MCQPPHSVADDKGVKIESKGNDKIHDQGYMAVKEMAQDGAKEVPSDFVLPPHLQPGRSNAALEASKIFLPVIDLAGVNDKDKRKRILKSIAEASRDWGFFQVVGHGVSAELRQKMLSSAREFFHLPLAEKSKFVQNHANPTFPIFGQTRKTVSGHNSWRDVFKHRSLPAGKEDVQNWPVNPEAYRDTVTEYSQAVKKVSDTLLELLAEGLKLESNCFLNSLGGESMTYVIMSAFYPRCPQPELALGIIGHTDPNPLTLLIEDQAGLEVMRDGVWNPVEAVPDGFVVNIGDVLQVMSNDRMVSSEHRVVAHENLERVSVMLFVQPEMHVRIGVTPELVTDESPARYNDTTWEHFLTSYGLKGLDCKVTDFVTKE